MNNPVTAIAAAEPQSAQQHFSAVLSFETDCWDTHSALQTAAPGFVLLDVRSPELYARGHVAGAINLPHRKLTEASLRPYPRSTLFVTYCAGPHCNGATRAALRLAQLGYRVKLMAGGITGWLDEGFSLQTQVSS